MDIEKKLQEYDEAFDFYLDQGRMPDTMHPEDPLAGFMKQTFAANPQLDGQDPLWTEILKDEMMKFLEAMLKLYQPIIQAYHQEKTLPKKGRIGKRPICTSYPIIAQTR